MHSSEEFIRTKYPFIDLSVVRIPQFIDNLNSYDTTSCSVISSVAHAGMRTCDYIQKNFAVQTVPIYRLMGDLWQMFWGCYVEFYKISQVATGISTVTVTSQASDTLSLFNGWDEAFSANPPFSDIGNSFFVVLNGVTP